MEDDEAVAAERGVELRVEARRAKGHHRSALLEWERLVVGVEEKHNDLDAATTTPAQRSAAIGGFNAVLDQPTNDLHIGELHWQRRNGEETSRDVLHRSERAEGEMPDPQRGPREDDDERRPRSRDGLAK